MNQKCFVRLDDSWRNPLKGTIIAFVPAKNPATAVGHRGYSPTDTDKIHQEPITVDAIVRLAEYDASKLYQIPLRLIDVCDEWDDRYKVT